MATAKRDGGLSMTEPDERPRHNDTSPTDSAIVGEEPVQRFFFVHLQKTGGTTLIHRLPRRFRPNEIYPDASDGPIETAVLSVDDLCDRWRARGAEIRVITGHFPLCTKELLGGDLTTLTVLREPVERTLSYLRHHRASIPADSSKSLEEIYEDPFRFGGLIQNHMVKMLSLTVETMSDGALTRANLGQSDLTRAQENLETVDVVGLLDEFDAFWDELRLRFGWQLGEPARSNQTEPVPVSRSFRARIAQDNELDAELYRYANGVFSRRQTRSMSTHRARIG
jgi:hypothetical protein